MDTVFSEEFRRNLQRIEEAYPEKRLLNKRQMADFLGLRDVRYLENYGIDTKLTRESFAMRLTKGGKE